MVTKYCGCDAPAGKTHENCAVAGFVALHPLRLLWLSNDFTHGCPYVSAVSPG